MIQYINTIKLIQLLLERVNHRVNKNIFQEGVKFIKGGDNDYE